jgi:hypothetical protein
VRAPSKIKKNPLASFLNLELLNVDEDVLEKVWRQKYKHDHYSLDDLRAKRRMQVMMCGVIEPPRLVCPKSMFDN